MHAMMMAHHLIHSPKFYCRRTLMYATDCTNASLWPSHAVCVAVFSRGVSRAGHLFWGTRVTVGVFMAHLMHAHRSDCCEVHTVCPDQQAKRGVGWLSERTTYGSMRETKFRHTFGSSNADTIMRVAPRHPPLGFLCCSRIQWWWMVPFFHGPDGPIVQLAIPRSRTVTFISYFSYLSFNKGAAKNKRKL